MDKAERKFIDERYPDVTVTESQLHTEYRMSDSIDEMNFHQWLENCMQYNNGTLFEVK